MVISWQIRRQNLIPDFPVSQSPSESENWADDEARTGGKDGQNFLPETVESIHSQT